MMSPLKLVESQPLSHDTIECLKQLLALAESGRLFEFAGVLQQGRREFLFAYTGDCYTDPYRTRGALETLADKLGDLARFGDV